MQIHDILTLLKEEFGKGILKDDQLRSNRALVKINPAIIVAVADFLFNKHGLRFITASGFDSREGIEIMYHFMHDESGFILNVNVVLSREKTEIESITPLIVCANWIEREMMEILGIKFINHPQPEKLLSEDNWDEGVYPYRRVIKEV